MVAVCDEIPAWKRLPGRDAHYFAEGRAGERLLHRMHHFGLDGLDIGREVVDEVILGQPGETLLVDVEVRQSGARRRLTE